MEIENDHLTRKQQHTYAQVCQVITTSNLVDLHHNIQEASNTVRATQNPHTRRHIYIYFLTLYKDRKQRHPQNIVVFQMLV